MRNNNKLDPMETGHTVIASVKWSMKFTPRLVRLIILVKYFILDVWEGSKYASEPHNQQRILKFA